MESGDPRLINAVQTKSVSLRQAALSVRQGIKLVEAYVDSSLTDKAHLGHVVGAEKVFDEVVVPALDPTISAVAMATVTTPKSNDKATNGTRSHLYGLASPANVSTH